MALRVRRNLGELVYSSVGFLTPGELVPAGVVLSASLTEDGVSDPLSPPGPAGVIPDFNYRKVSGGGAFRNPPPPGKSRSKWG